MKRFIFFSGVIAAGCQSQPPVIDTLVRETPVLVEVYPNLPLLEEPDTPELEEVFFDIPRDITKPKIVIGTPDCLSMSQEETLPENFENECMRHPPMFDSNLFIGLTQEEYEKLRTNQLIVALRESLWQSALARRNAERAEWRERNLNVKPVLKNIESEEE